jgi:hypothetical protein
VAACYVASGRYQLHVCGVFIKKYLKKCVEPVAVVGRQALFISYNEFKISIEK